MGKFLFIGGALDGMENEVFGELETITHIDGTVYTRHNVGSPRLRCMQTVYAVSGTPLDTVLLKTVEFFK